MERRPLIAAEFRTSDHRLYYQVKDIRAAKMVFKQALVANASALRPIFEQLQMNHLNGIVSEQTWDEQLKVIQNRPGLNMDKAQAILSDPRERIRIACANEASAEIILRSMDDLLTSLVVAFSDETAERPKDHSLSIAQKIPPGVPLDDVLDAIGNYIRHRQEWRWYAFLGKKFTKQQKKSILPLARIMTKHIELNESKSDEAYKAFIQEPFPMLTILDMLSGYTLASGRGSYDTLEATIAQAAEHIIDAQFPLWWEKYRKKILPNESATPGFSFEENA